jgi:hypothetical protein
MAGEQVRKDEGTPPANIALERIFWFSVNRCVIFFDQ